MVSPFDPAKFVPEELCLVGLVDLAMTFEPFVLFPLETTFELALSTKSSSLVSGTSSLLEFSFVCLPFSFVCLPVSLVCLLLLLFVCLLPRAITNGVVTAFDGFSVCVCVCVRVCVCV